MDTSGPQFPQDFIPADQQRVGLERRTLFKRNDEQETPSDNLASVIVYLSTLYSKLKEDEQQPAAPATAVDRGQKVLKSKRLPRSGASLEQRMVEFGDRGDAVNFTNTGLEKLDDATKIWGIDGGETRFALQLQSWGVTLAVGCAVLLVALGVMTALYLGDRGSKVKPGGAVLARPAVLAGGDEGAVSDEALKFSGLALDAIGRGDLAKASEVLEEAQNRQLALPGMCYQGALLALSQQNEDKMEGWIDRALEANEAVPECLYLRANSEAFKSDFKAAAATLETAARNAPFSPRYLFFWAECLRRQGTPRLALAPFKEALRCRPGSGDAELILFKTSLARIETGDDETIQADLANRLAQEPVSGDTLLLAAANEINRNAYPAAADFLRRAGHAMALPTLRLRLRDYLFRTQAQQPDIAPVWKILATAIATNAPPQPGRQQLVDPATRGLAEADPAGW